MCMKGGQRREVERRGQEELVEEEEESEGKRGRMVKEGSDGGREEMPLEKIPPVGRSNMTLIMVNKKFWSVFIHNI